MFKLHQKMNLLQIGGGLMRLDVDLIMCIMTNRGMSNPKHKHKQLSLPDNKSRNTSYICFNVESTIVLHLHCGRRSMLVGICFIGTVWCKIVGPKLFSTQFQKKEGQILNPHQKLVGIDPSNIIIGDL